MKQVFLFFSIAILFFACDKVKSPIQAKSGSAPVAKIDTVRNVLLEDYTGHTCGNCPKAAIRAEQLEEENSPRVVVIAVHAGPFAKTQGKYVNSYTTTAGNDWDGTAGFNISSGAGNPNGLINRKDFGSGIIQGIDKWSSSVAQGLKFPFILGFTITPIYPPETRNLSLTIKAKFKKAYPSDVKLIVVLTEDSIIGPQLNYDIPAGSVNNYVFMNMLRGSLNGSWGQTLKAAPVNVNDSVSVSISNFAVNSAYNDKQLYVVAFAYDGLTREVIQVKKVKIR